MMKILKIIADLALPIAIAAGMITLAISALKNIQALL
jgi:hypothetical protein